MSHNRDRNETCGEEQHREIYHPVPNYINRSRRSRSPTELTAEPENPSLNRHLIDEVVDEIYNLSDHSDAPLSPSRPLSKGHQRKNQYHDLYLLSHSSSAHTDMVTSSFGPHHPPDMHPNHHTSRPQSTVSSNHTTGHATDKKKTTCKQMEEYKKKAFLLQEELTMLRKQRNELRGDGKRSPSPDTKRFLKENTKLQLDIQNKLKTINNVLEMVNDIMGEHDTRPREPSSPKRKSKQKWSQKFNYVFYDPELHWCRVCNVFPQTAKDYLNHLHSEHHQTMAAEHEEFPWHNVVVDEGYLTLPDAPTKRTPIRGLQFFVPTVAWYCKLCDQFIGDLHCASIHIKSIAHSKSYNKFVQQNPHWETDWVSDRQRAYELKTKHDAQENKETCSVQYVTQTLTISKDVRTKRSSQALESEARKKSNHQYERNSNGNGSRATHGDGSDREDLEETRIQNKRFKSVETVNLHRSDSPSTIDLIEAMFDDDDRNLPDIPTRSNVRDRQVLNRHDSRHVQAHRGRSKERRERSCERRGRSRDNKARYRDNKDYSRDNKDRSWDNMGRNRDNRDRNRDNRDLSWDNTDRSRDRKGSKSDRSESSLDRSGSYQDKRGNIQGRKGSRDKVGSNQDTRGTSGDKKIDSQATVPPTTPVLSSQLPLGSGILPPPSRHMPKPTALPARKPQVPALPQIAALPAMTALPPIIMPPPASLLPPGTIPDVPKEFIEQLEQIFPTDPNKCAEMLSSLQEQQQHPSLLGPPPTLPLPFPMGLMNPGMFPFDYSAVASMAGLFTPPVPLANQRNNANNQRRNKPQSSNSSVSKNPQTNASDKSSHINDLTILGIDETDVSAEM